MLKMIKDCKGHCACFADAATGVIEHKWKKVKTSTRISIGGEYRIERDDTVTIIRRINSKEFQVMSYITAA